MVTAIQDVSFQLDEGERIGIVGESGAGKTEATKIILAYLARAGQGFTGPEEDLLYKKPTQAEAK